MNFYFIYKMQPQHIWNVIKFGLDLKLNESSRPIEEWKAKHEWDTLYSN